MGLERWYRRECLVPAVYLVRDCIRCVELESRNGFPAALIDLSHRIAEGIVKPSAFHLDHSLRDFATSLTGNGLRWEVVGLILSIGGFSAIQ